ncbi:potassium channel family protein [Microterricola viridarii]|uniref:Voltage-gated potassium channel n=1 Tax=Microterricola viridarii TaxID=412690 RepID=A0A1H1SQV6_9MICO|nr:potassium channel family protein [Microterricola viridarii]SDS50233.1 voltage-gated potassium channel [Microterricola viridarii]
MSQERPLSASALHREEVRGRWERATRWPLILLSIGFLVAYSLVTIRPSWTRDEQILIVVVLGAAWLAFIIDPVVRLILTAPHRRAAYVRTYKVEFWAALLPILRPFSLLRHLDSTPGFMGNGGNALRSRVLAVAAAYAGMYVYVIAITVLQVERNAPGATIVTFGEAIWWAFVTLATVGYGDYVPITPFGRTLAVMLMAGGVVIIGTASALIVSYLSERITTRDPGAVAPRKPKPRQRDEEED